MTNDNKAPAPLDLSQFEGHTPGEHYIDYEGAEKVLKAKITEDLVGMQVFEVVPLLRVFVSRCRELEAEVERLTTTFQAYQKMAGEHYTALEAHRDKLKGALEQSIEAMATMHAQIAKECPALEGATDIYNAGNTARAVLADVQGEGESKERDTDARM